MSVDPRDAAEELTSAVHAFSLKRRRSAVVVHGLIDGAMSDQIAERLQGGAPATAIDVILTTQGGTATAALRTMRLLRNAADVVTVLVPRRARSAGTLFCLGADELVVSATTEFGPLDPITAGSAGGGPTTAISASDVRGFVLLASDWFRVSAREAEVLALISQHVSPIALAQIYRSESLVRRVARELIPRNAPTATRAEVDALTEHLVTSYESHDYPITPDELRALGVNLRYGGHDEIASTHQVTNAARRLFDAAAYAGTELPTIVEVCVTPTSAAQPLPGRDSALPHHAPLIECEVSS